MQFQRWLVLQSIIFLWGCQKETASLRPAPIEAQSFQMTINGQVWRADTVHAIFFASESFFLVTAESRFRKVEIRFRATQPATLSLHNNLINYASVSLGDRFPPPARVAHEGDHVEYYVTQHPNASGSLQLIQVFQDLVSGRFQFEAIALPTEGGVIHIPKIVVTDGSFHTKVIKR